MEVSRLTRDGTVEPVSRDQILRRERRQGNIDFPCSADHEQDWHIGNFTRLIHTLALCDDHDNGYSYDTTCYRGGVMFCQNVSEGSKYVASQRLSSFCKEFSA